MAEKDAGEGQHAQQATEVVVDDSGTLPSYSNFCRVTATPEEVILDFGLNPQPFATGRQEVKAIQRIVMNFYTSKRLLTALGMTIQRHEGTFGAIELDVRRRAGSSTRRTAAAAVPAAGPGPGWPAEHRRVSRLRRRASFPDQLRQRSPFHRESPGLSPGLSAFPSGGTGIMSTSVPRRGKILVDKPPVPPAAPA